MRWDRYQRTSLACGMLCAALAPVLSCSGSGDPTDDGSDGTLPGSVTDLAVTTVTPRTASLGWTAPTGGDEDAGPASAYDLRHASSPITDATWPAAAELPNEPAPLPPGMAQAMTVSGLAPGTTYHFALKSRDDLGEWSALSNPAVAVLPAEIEVVFADTVLDSLIRTLIQKPSGPIYPDDLTGILILEAESLGIADLGGIAACTSVWRLNAAHNAISELAPLAGMAGLQTLILAGNQIADLAPVATLTGLTYLGIGSNQIDELGPLAALPNLDALNAAENQIADLAPLAGLEQMDYLYLNANQIVNLGPLAGLIALRELYLAANDVVDLSSLAALTQLQYLSLDANAIADLAPLVANAGLGAGDTIWLRSNPLSPEAINVQIPALQARGATVIW